MSFVFITLVAVFCSVMDTVAVESLSTLVTLVGILILEVTVFVISSELKSMLSSFMLLTAFTSFSSPAMEMLED